MLDRSQLVSDFGRQMFAVARAWRRCVGYQAHASGLSDAQWSIVDNLNRSGDGVVQGILADRMGLERSALVRVIRELEADGVILRQDDPHHAKQKRVFLTELGHQKAQEVLEIIAPLEARITQGRTSEELALMLALFGDFRQRISEIEAERTLPPSKSGPKEDLWDR